MLVLSRKKNESIVIDGNIVVTVLQVHGNRVRLGIEAPADVGIHRIELRRGRDSDSAKELGRSPATRKEACDLQAVLV